MAGSFKGMHHPNILSSFTHLVPNLYDFLSPHKSRCFDEYSCFFPYNDDNGDWACQAPKMSNNYIYWIYNVVFFNTNVFFVLLQKILNATQKTTLWDYMAYSIIFLFFLELDRHWSLSTFIVGITATQILFTEKINANVAFIWAEMQYCRDCL